MWGKSYPASINIYTEHVTHKYNLSMDDSTSEDSIRKLCEKDWSSYQFSMISKIDVSSTRRVRFSDTPGTSVRCTFTYLARTRADCNLHLTLHDCYVRNKKLYLDSGASLFSEWITSLHLLSTASYTIISNEIYYKPPTKLRRRAVVCAVAAPALALMGILMPFASCYFNRIVGDLDCWMNDYDNEDIACLSPTERQTNSGRCFAIDSQAYTFIGENPDRSGNIHIAIDSIGIEGISEFGAHTLVALAFANYYRGGTQFYREGKLVPSL